MATTTSIQEIEWPGISGSTYSYKIYPINQTFNDVDGNYIFAKEGPADNYTPLYIGQGNLADRTSNPQKPNCIKSNGATHIHAHVNSAKAARLAEERDLIDNWNPVCNG